MRMFSVFVFRVLIVTLAFFCVPGGVLLGQEGFSPERLEKIDQFLEDATGHDHRVAGVAALVARNGRIVYVSAKGFRDIEAGDPLEQDDIFRIASQTKTITAIGVMMLYEEGKLLLDDPVSKYIPEFRNAQVLKTFNEADSTYTTVPVKKEPTLRQLITHTSGLSYAVIGTKEARAIYAKAGVRIGFEPLPYKLADKMKTLAGLPLMNEPGTVYSYSLGLDMAGYLIEVISEQPLNEFFRERIFDPLGMKDTYFYIPPAKQSRLVTLYGLDEHWKTIPRKNDPALDHTYPLARNGTYYSGGAGLCSTVKDYAAFLQMLLNGGEYNGHRLLSPHTIRLITNNQIGDLGMGGSPNKMGLGFEITTEKGALQGPAPEGAFGFGGFWGTWGWADPSNDLVMVLMTQHSTFFSIGMMQRFRIMVYSALTE
ncbi:MAG TPA: serine hydrolase domain-containing protein [Anseongella sp.]